MKPLIKYRCQTRSGEVGYALYIPTMDAVQVTTWGNVLQKNDEGTYAKTIGERKQCIGRPSSLIAGYTIEAEWTAADERVFQSERRSRQDAFDMGFLDKQLSLFSLF